MALAFCVVPVSAQGRCTAETLSIAGTQVAASYCVVSERADAAAHAVQVVVDETFTNGATNFVQRSTLGFVDSAGEAQTIDDVSLEHIGLAYTLHQTLTHGGGVVRLKHALLLPGATPVK
jgi:hypothetical protein